MGSAGRVLVTGSAGFIGKHVVRGLESSGWSVTGYDFPDNICELGHVSDFDAIVNLAAIGGAGKAAARPREVFKNNAVAAISLRGALQPVFGPESESGAVWPSVVHVSSFSVYGDAAVPTTEDAPLQPKEIYGASKLCQELAWIGYPGPLTILRLSSVYGPGMDLNNSESTVIAKIAKAARDSEEFEVYEDGNQTRDFVHVDDVVACVVAALERQMGQDVVNVCSGRPISIKDACVALGAKYRVTGNSRPGDMRACLGSTARMEALLGRKPLGFTPLDILKVR